MATIICKDCGKEISDSSKACIYCGCPTKASINAEKERKTQEAWNNMSPKEKKIGTIITVIILAVIAVFLYKACSGSTTSNYNTETNAKICAEKAVEDRLKAPSTAKFCSYSQMTATNLGGDKWRVSGYVDAQNSFGASLRQYWTVTLTLTKTGFKDYYVTFS